MAGGVGALIATVDNPERILLQYVVGLIYSYL